MNSLTLAAILLLCSTAHAASDRCLLKPDAGPCEALIPKYFFDPKTKTCKRFIWGGCKGVVPFQTAADCKAAKCAGANPCSLKPDPGPCKASIPKYFFDPITKTCRKFIWGGCQGVVPFNTAADCEAERCAGEDPCSLKPDAGFCRAYIPRYFWNSSTKMCQRFIWGGCGGVVPFTSLSKCENAQCGTSSPKCKLLPDPGRCLALFRRYFYDQKTQTCKQFVWGGCGGVVPFHSAKECKSANC